MDERTVRFVCEQDGVPEQQFKDALIVALQALPAVQKAYLARVDFGDPSAYPVDLCLSASEDPGAVHAVSAVFGRIFQAKQHLDIVFLTPQQETELARICRPFYIAA